MNTYLVLAVALWLVLQLPLGILIGRAIAWGGDDR